MLSKSDEKAILRNTVALLGVNSYSALWLADQIPAIEFAIDSDDCVESRALGFTESRQQSAAILRNAKEEAAQILTDARKEADQIRSKANRFDDEIRAELGRSIQSILNRI
jgi:cell division septum initiation protein DivIVA